MAAALREPAWFQPFVPHLNIPDLQPYKPNFNQKKMTDSASQESSPVPDPTIVDPCPVQNGHGFTNNHHPQPKSPGQPEGFTTGQEMKITDSVEGEGNFNVSKLTHLGIHVCARVSGIFIH